MIPSGIYRFAAPIIRDVSSTFDPNEMVLRFRERADAVKRRGFPPVEGPERQRFIEAANLDFQDFAMLGDATATLEDGILRLEIDLRPPSIFFRRFLTAAARAPGPRTTARAPLVSFAERLGCDRPLRRSRCSTCAAVAKSRRPWLSRFVACLSGVGNEDCIEPSSDTKEGRCRTCGGRCSSTVVVGEVPWRSS